MSADGTVRKMSIMAALRTSFGVLCIAVVAMWVIEILDSVVLDNWAQRHGIHPREINGIDGIAWAPFLHSDMGHLVSNTGPLLALGGLVSVRGFRYWGGVTLASAVIGGGLTWWLGGSGNHIGASGVVYGYFGALIAAAIKERRPRAMAAAFVPIFIYNTMLVGLVPQPFISWEGHLFGMIGGAIAALVMAEPRKPKLDTSVDPGPVYSWEVDQPWLTGEAEGIWAKPSDAGAEPRNTAIEPRDTGA